YKKVANRWIAEVLDVVHLLCQLPRSVWRHTPTESPAPGSESRHGYGDVIASGLMSGGFPVP
ncbi:hypothetical protein Tco_1307633, partial [Tanacetum coccineum]